MEQRSTDSSAAVNATFHDGNTIPRVGLGTFGLCGDDGVRAIAGAIELGYRLLDTAVNYNNEREVGAAIRQAGVSSDEMFVTTKVPGRSHGRELAQRSVEDSLRTLGIDRLDLVLIHWPIPRNDRYVEAWEGLILARERDLVRSIGVSNFTEAHLHRVVEATGVVPVLNQLEVHPLFPQRQMREHNSRFGILTQAWSPLGKQLAPYSAPPIATAALRHGVSPAQVILRWHLELGTLPIPKSRDRERQRANLALNGFRLSEDEVREIGELGVPDGRLFGGDPDLFEEM